MKFIKQNVQKGFTLIELMITVAIIGILSSIALPAYKDYTIRAQVTEAISLANGLKPYVSEYHSYNGNFSGISNTAYPRSSGTYVTGVGLLGPGIILASFGNKANSALSGGILYLVPQETSSKNLEWYCVSEIHKKYLPSTCREGVPDTSED